MTHDPFSPIVPEPADLRSWHSEREQRQRDDFRQYVAGAIVTTVVSLVSFAFGLFLAKWYW